MGMFQYQEHLPRDLCKNVMCINNDTMLRGEK